MAEQYAISAANLNYIERNLNAIHGDLEVIDKSVDTVNDNVKVVYDEIGSLAQEFHDFVQLQVRANRKQQAQTDLVRVRQELDKEYGHHDKVRRSATGILQASDLGLIRKDVIMTASEEMMIDSPRYWLAPCLVALAAWITDNKELAAKATKEGLRRDDEKTSLFFALICRRADRKDAALKWMQRYLANQDEEDLDRETIVVLDAYAAGLMGSDSEGLIAKQIDEWMGRLSAKPGFVEQQKDQWSGAIKLKREPLSGNDYPYLRKYSHTWPILEDVMEGANLHAKILSYFISIFEQQVSNDSIRDQLDDVLNNLVSEFDSEELPLRKEEKFNQLIIQYDGDEKRAQQDMAIEQTAFDTHKDFTQLLTDAAMKPESSNAGVSTQKFAIALSKEWISDAYTDIVAENRMKVPHEIEINLDTFNDKTTDGQNEREMIPRWNSHVEREKKAALDKCVLSTFDKFCLYGGIAIAVVGLLAIIFGAAFLGIIAIIAGAGLVIKYFTKKKSIDANRVKITEQFDQKRTSGEQIIRATLAEVVDFRMEFDQKDAESSKVFEFLDQISPEQYVRKLADSNRRIIRA